jgi:hypothetical protein
MIILDTNVLSAFMQEQADPLVRDWLDGLGRREAWTTAITVYEMRYGVAVLPAGRRQKLLFKRLEDVIAVSLRNQVLPFDLEAAHVAAAIGARRKQAGRPVGTADIQIGAIAVVHKAPVATRNAKHFSDLGVPVINPWR